mmetsp:Transcript_15973/g.18267  ORF Transcript_15973/g.18267 Transcript_15973/m.18267 type:complete len:99 (+) Transcript_15973:1391-1687(+)
MYRCYCDRNTITSSIAITVTSTQAFTYLSASGYFSYHSALLQRYENTRVVEVGEKPLGRDMWSKILYEYLKGSDLQCYEKSVIRQLKACQRLEQERNE